MAMTIQVEIVSAKEIIFSGKAEMVFAPATMGEVGITPRHTPLLSSLKPGEVRIHLDNKEDQTFYVSGGILEVQPHKVSILSDTAVRAHDLVEAAALEAKERAEKLLSDKKSGIDYAKAQSELIEAMAQLRSIERLRKRK
jgi:F-type H+-transporting ATPase subunit epsilon